MENLFMIDNVGYRVHVLNLTRKFAVLDTENTGRTMDGRMYREPIGTFYNYSMTVAPMGDSEDLEKFWEVVSQPAISHYCQFPYGQKTLSQHMYITSGEQELIRAGAEGNFWGEVTVNFIAMTPKVVA
jgi:hypothetical protein